MRIIFKVDGVDLSWVGDGPAPQIGDVFRYLRDGKLEKYEITCVKRVYVKGGLGDFCQAVCTVQEVPLQSKGGHNGTEQTTGR